MNLNDLETFVFVAEAGSFAGAAERLGVPRSTVSRRVTRLEDALGRALLHRSGRSVELTEDGRALYARCAAPLREIAAVERGIGDAPDAPSGRLTITTPIDLGASDFVAELLTEYAARHPAVQVGLKVTNRTVDLLEEQVDLAFRMHSASLPDRDDLVARPLGRLAFALYASPAYLQRRPAPTVPGALAGHTVIAQSQAYREHWPHPPALTADDFHPVAALVAAGAGIGGLPDFVAAPYLEAGRVVRLDVPWDVPPATLSLLWLRSRHLAPRVRAFIDLTLERTEQVPWLR